MPQRSARFPLYDRLNQPNGGRRHHGFGAPVARQWFACKPRERRKFRILAVNDDCTRENPGLITDISLSGARAARGLTAMIRIYAKPHCLVSDTATEFTSTAILKCRYGD